MKQYAFERPFPDDLDADQAWQQLHGLLGSRIAEGLAGKVSPRNVGEILEDELAERPEEQPPLRR